METESEIKFVECDPETATGVVGILPAAIVQALVYVGDGFEVPSHMHSKVVKALKELGATEQKK